MEGQREYSGGRNEKEGMAPKYRVQKITAGSKGKMEVFLQWEDGIEERSEVGGGLDIDQQLTTYHTTFLDWEEFRVIR